MTDPQKFEQLETTLAHHERQLEELSDLITAQWQEIERLKRALIKTEAKIEDYLSSSEDDKNLSSSEIAARDKPPHY